MDVSTNAKLLDFQANTKYFFDSAGHCFDHCVKSFDSKELSANEKSCVNACFSKQMIIYGNLLQVTHKKQ
jgi:hypothetical protein